MNKPKQKIHFTLSDFLLIIKVFLISDIAAASIYFAGDAPPATSDRPSESSLCYSFNVDSLETQLTKLKRKYSDSLLAAGITVTSEGARVLTAHRFDASGRRIDYFYSDKPEACDAYQRRRGVSFSAQNTPPTSSPVPLPAVSDSVPDPAVLEQSLIRHFPALADQVKAGDANAQYRICLAYAAGTDIDKDWVAAAYWCRKAAEQGHLDAQNELGYAYGQGYGVPQSDIEAVKWYRLAAEQGHAMAQYNLGVMYGNGKGVPKDDVEAVKWYQLAANQGNTSAQNNLGRMYENGKGVLQDWVMAYTLYNLAAARGQKIAISNREELIGKLTNRQIEEGQRLSRLWKPGASLPHQSETGTAPDPAPASDVPPAPEISSTGECRPTGTAIRCQSRCVNGDCIVTYENGCKVRVQVKPAFNPFNNQWEYPSPSC